MFPHAEQIEDLTDEATTRHLVNLMSYLSAYIQNNDYVATETKGYLLSTLIEALDETDNDDSFGTEGWRHALG